MTRDYVTLYLSINSFPYDAGAFLALLFLAVARLFPIIALSPFFGGKILPRPVKVIFGLSLFAVMLPKLLLVTEGPIAFDVKLLVLFVKEILLATII